MFPPHGPHITRYSMYAALTDVCATDGRGAGKEALVISHSDDLVETIGIGNADRTEASYPEYNLLDLQFDDESFDYIVSDQVLEHIEGSPQLAFDESRRVLRPGGIAIHTTAFIYPIHEFPIDMWRFTPRALEYLARDFSEIILSDGWGNRLVWLAEWLKLGRVPVPHAKWHPLHRVAVANNSKWPVTTWIVARK